MLLDIAGFWMLNILVWEMEIMEIGPKKNSIGVGVPTTLDITAALH
jgi:hypothetical protein